MSIGNILVAILIFSFVVIFHELGHFLFAKKNGIGVTEFTLGLGPRLFGIKRGETTYALRLFPIGGACMMVGEDQSSDDERAFNNKTIWQRFQVVFAGPLFNFILAFLLSLIMVFLCGYDPARVTNVSQGSAAEAAGLQAGDIITKIDGSTINFGREIMVKYTYDPIENSDPIKITYKRNGEKFTTTLVPEKIVKYYLGFTYTAEASAAAAIGEVTSGGVFEAAGLKKGDIIREINGTKIGSGEELLHYFNDHALSDEEVTIVYERNAVNNTITVTPKRNETYDLGFSYNMYAEKTAGFAVIKYSAAEVKYWIVTTVKGLGQIFRGKVSADDLGGPVRIVSEISNVMDEAKPYGFLITFVELLNWAVLLSANLGIMNLLPIPALDGGRIFFLIIEKLRGKPMDRDKEGIVNGIFFILLLALMAFIFYNDIRNLFIK